VNSVVAFVLLLPRNLSVLVLRLYRAVVSPLYGDVCRYYPSCSSYALQAIQLDGDAPDRALPPLGRRRSG
jgi:putative component of membrane protein insertase Oxa1/YidC/SpoIIIJ protein YidD